MENLNLSTPMNAVIVMKWYLKKFLSTKPCVKVDQSVKLNKKNLDHANQREALSKQTGESSHPQFSKRLK